MSFPADEITCTGCGYEGIDGHRPIWLIYRLQDGTQVRLGREFGWCAKCAKLRDIEPRLDAAEIKLELAQLEAKTRNAGFLIGDALRTLFRRPRHQLREQVEDLLAQLELAERRVSRPRCLTCGTEGATAVTFGSGGLSDFVHDCGGRFRLQHGDWNGLRFHYDLEEILLDGEGRRLAL